MYFGQSTYFWNFWVLGSEFVKFLMSVLNLQATSFSIYASFFIVITHKSPVNFKLIHFLLWIKEPNKSPNFETFMCFGEDLPNSSCHFPNRKSLFLQILHHSLVSWNIILCTFLVQTLYTFVKSILLKCNFLRLSNAQVKICQIPYVNFETKSEFLFRFFLILQCRYT